MARKDVLAAGGKKMTIAGGIGDTDIFRNVAKEEAEPEVAPVIVDAPKPKLKKFVPLNNVLLVRPYVEQKPESVIITETIEQEKPAEGYVVERGPEVAIAVGAHVVYGKYSGTEFKLNGEVLLLMKIDDILGTVIDDNVEEINTAFNAAVEAWGMAPSTPGRA